MKIDDIVLKQTCSTCPEQYEAFFEGKKVGFLRLRHGVFQVFGIKDGAIGDLIFVSLPNGDNQFDDDERESHLNKAKEEIIISLRIKNPPEIVYLGSEEC